MNRVRLEWFPVLLLLTASCGSDYYRGYLEEHAGFTFPKGTVGMEHFTGSDIAFTSFCVIPSDSLEGFIAAAGLGPSAPGEWDPILHAEELSVNGTTVPVTGNLYYGAGSSGWNSWDLLLDRDTGRFWATVYFTDASGDPPN